MPAVSKAQQAMMAIAKHSPGKLFARNKGVLKMSKDEMEKYASTPTKGLPKHKNALRSMVEGNTKVARKVAKGGGK